MPSSRLCVNDKTEAPLDLKRQTDNALVELAKRGEANAFSELVQRYNQYCLWQANRSLRNREDAEDEVQNAWLKVWTHLASYRGEGSFEGWLSRIVFNLCLSRLRHARYTPTLSVNKIFASEGPFRLEIIDQQARPDQVAGNEEALDLLSKAINGLPPFLREVLVMRDVRQREIGDVAADLGIGLYAAKSRLMRARLELKARLDKHYGGQAPLPRATHGIRTDDLAARPLEVLLTGSEPSYDPRMMPSTYIIGKDSSRERYFVIRTESPRFIAELVEPDQADDGLIFEGGEGLRINQWIDAPQPASSIQPLLAEIYDEVSHYSDTHGLRFPAGESTAAEPAIPPLDFS